MSPATTTLIAALGGAAIGGTVGGLFALLAQGRSQRFQLEQEELRHTLERRVASFERRRAAYAQALRWAHEAHTYALSLTTLAAEFNLGVKSRDALIEATEKQVEGAEAAREALELDGDQEAISQLDRVSKLVMGVETVVRLEFLGRAAEELRNIRMDTLADAAAAVSPAIVELVSILREQLARLDPLGGQSHETRGNP